MGSDVERIKERLDVAEVVSGYVKLDKAGASFKGRCPFHTEKTPSFFVSPVRQSYYCFGCGAKGDIFTFVQEMEGLSFREALKSLAERAGVELSNRPEAARAKGEKEEILQALEIATQFFEEELRKSDLARKYVLSRGITEASVRKWRLGYAPAEWRSLYSHMLSLGLKREVLLKAGLIKNVQDSSGKEPYDVFRDRIIFPLSHANGEIIAFSGRALAKETEPKYLNSPDTVLFTKSEVLYGLDKAKEKIRKQNYAVLVEGQIDLVLSHQSGVENAVASSGTAFTLAHLERLKKLSKRIILAFDGDAAGKKAGEKAAELGISLGLEVKATELPEGMDPAELVRAGEENWRMVLKKSLPAIEVFLNQVILEEKDVRKSGLAIQRKILPLLTLLESSIERSHFVSLIAQRTGIKEEIIWEDLRKVKKSPIGQTYALTVAAKVGKAGQSEVLVSVSSPSRREKIEERLTEVRAWLAEQHEGSESMVEFKKEETELLGHLLKESLGEELSSLHVALVEAESSKDSKQVEELTVKIQDLWKKLRAMEEKGV